MGGFLFAPVSALRTRIPEFSRKLQRIPEQGPSLSGGDLSVVDYICCQ